MKEGISMATEKHCDNCKYSYKVEDSEQHCSNDTYNSLEYTTKMLNEDWGKHHCRLWEPKE